MPHFLVNKRRTGLTTISGERFITQSMMVEQMMIGIISLTMKSAMVIRQDMKIGMTMKKIIFMMMMKICLPISNLR